MAPEEVATEAEADKAGGVAGTLPNAAADAAGGGGGGAADRERKHTFWDTR